MIMEWAARGGAYGMKFEILNKLDNMKPLSQSQQGTIAANAGDTTSSSSIVQFAQKGTMMHFVVEIMMTQYEDKCVFFDLWAAVWEAARVSIYITLIFSF